MTIVINTMNTSLRLLPPRFLFSSSSFPSAMKQRPTRVHSAGRTRVGTVCVPEKERVEQEEKEEEGGLREREGSAV